MAPVSQADSHDVVEKQLKDVIQDLYQLMIQVNSYDLAGRPSRDVLETSVKQLDLTLQKIHGTANHSNTQLPSIPPELIQYVDTGRNPDIYTREFVELARKGNQLMKGKLEAFGSFRDVLAEAMVAGLPELRRDVLDVVVKTGGREDAVEKEEKSS